MKKILLFVAMVVLFASCNQNNPEQEQLVGAWSEPFHVNTMVKSITFYDNGMLIYTDSPDTTWPQVIDYAGVFAKMKYKLKNNQLHFSGMYNYINENAKRDSIPFSFSSGYTIKDNTLTIDSFAYDGGINTLYVKPLVLHRIALD